MAKETENTVMAPIAVQGKDWSPVFIAFMQRCYLDSEGPLEHDPRDPGGATCWGIDQRSHPTVDLVSLTREGAMDYYWKEWKKHGFDAQQWQLAVVGFDAMQNQGIGYYQHMLCGRGFTWQAMVAERVRRYHETVEMNSHLSCFLTGWLNRIARLTKFIESYAKSHP